MHKLLERQLTHHFGGADRVSPALAPLVQAIDEAYEQADADRRLLERSLELTSQELLQKNQNLRQDLARRQQLEQEWQAQAEQLAAGNAELLRQQRVMQSLLEDLQASKDQVDEQHRWLEVANQRLEQSYSEVKAAQLQLIQAEKFESVGRLSAGVAHEVKNPLAILLMGVEYLLTQFEHGEPHTIAILEDMRKAVKRADAVIRGLLDFAASKELQMTTEDMHAVLEQSLLLVKHETDKSHVVVVKTFAQGLPPVRLDRMKIEQVLVNLFINAVHAMPHGGTITVTTSVLRLTQNQPNVGSRSTDRFAVGERVIRVDVDDEGTGIPAEHLQKIFDPFFTTKPTGQGTGLGLTVVKKIMELHGGAITVENRPQGGARMTLMFKLGGGERDGQEEKTADPHHR